NEEVGVLPAASDTIIVSPIAREMAKTIDAIIPEVAAGKTTFIATSNFVAPKPSAPSLILFGTDDIASSLILEIKGIIITPTTIPGLTELKLPNSGKILLSTGVTNVSAKKPNTIVGIPDKISKIGLIIFLTLVDAYSLRNNAAPKPIGTATNVAIAVILSVPKINAHIPYCGVEENGFQSLVNKNSVIGTRVKNVIVSVNNVTIIPTVANIEKIAMMPKMIGTILSLIPFFLALFLAIISLTEIF